MSQGVTISVPSAEEPRFPLSDILPKTVFKAKGYTAQVSRLVSCKNAPPRFVTPHKLTSVRSRCDAHAYLAGRLQQLPKRGADNRAKARVWPNGARRHFQARNISDSPSLELPSINVSVNKTQRVHNCPSKTKHGPDVVLSALERIT